MSRRWVNVERAVVALGSHLLGDHRHHFRRQHDRTANNEVGHLLSLPHQPIPVLDVAPVTELARRPPSGLEFPLRVLLALVIVRLRAFQLLCYRRNLPKTLPGRRNVMLQRVRTLELAALPGRFCFSSAAVDFGRVFRSPAFFRLSVPWAMLC